MKIGLDMHGVLDSNPKLFSDLTQSLYRQNWEIHLITGPEYTDELAIWLANQGIIWTHFFSIVSAHKGLGTTIEYDGQGNPWIDPYEWDRSKAEYCASQNIDLHLDDSDVYGYFFKTPYSRFFSKNTVRQSKFHLNLK